MLRKPRKSRVSRVDYARLDAGEDEDLPDADEARPIRHGQAVRDATLAFELPKASQVQAVAQVSGLSELLTLERPVLIMPGAKGASPAVDGSYKEPWFDWLQAFSTGYQVTTLDTMTQQPGPVLSWPQWRLYWQSRQPALKPASKVTAEIPQAAADDSEDDADSRALVPRKRLKKADGKPVNAAVTISSEAEALLLSCGPLPITESNLQGKVQAPALLQTMPALFSDFEPDPEQAFSAARGTAGEQTRPSEPPEQQRVALMPADPMPSELARCGQPFISMAAAGSFNSFQIASGGQAQWRHLISGKQVLMMIPPLRENLAAYAAWMQSPYKHACLLASFCRGCLTAHHAAGETIYIPGGWVTAMATVEGAIVISGLYFESGKLAQQLQVAELEEHLSGSRSLAAIELTFSAAQAAIAQLCSSSGMSKASLHHSIQQAAKLKDEPSAQQIAADLMGLANPEGLPEEPVTDPVSEGPFEPVGKPLRRSISVKLGVKTEAPSRETGAGGSAAQSGDAGDSAQPHAGISQVAAGDATAQVKVRGLANSGPAASQPASLKVAIRHSLDQQHMGKPCLPHHQPAARQIEEAEQGKGEEAPLSRRGRAIRRPARLMAGGDSGNESEEDGDEQAMAPVGKVRLKASRQLEQSNTTPAASRIKVKLPQRHG
ncbi:hypothetical protein WJX84_003283 [Apatococcus fuscideae]|uniref:JmjC domain-containing protein n=1 Tax=Apatococcus fuscideae TaxID=2026836 RepID=A0AAW1TDY1_9CHLO